MSTLYHFWSPLLHVIDGACTVCASRSTLAAVRFAASLQDGFFLLLFLFLFLRLWGVKWWCGLYPPDALEVGVNTQVRSQEGSREAGLHNGSHSIASGRVEGHMQGWGYVALYHQMR